MRVPSNSPFITGITSNFRKVSISVAVQGFNDPFTEADIKYIKIDSQDIPGRTFGVSYCHQLKLVFFGTRPNITKGKSVKVSFSCNGVSVSYPTFYVDEVQWNKVSGEKTIIGYDIMANANDIVFSTTNWTSGAKDIDYIANSVAKQLFNNNSATALWLGKTTCKPSQTWAPDDINTDGKASLRSIIKAIAEISGTIAYINSDDKLVFRGLTTTTITDDTNHFYNYTYNMTTALQYSNDVLGGQNITGIAHRNELNDAVLATDSTLGPDCVVLYDNPFLSKLQATAVQSVLDNIFSHITRYCTVSNVSHIGNPALELGDCMNIYIGTGYFSECYFMYETLEYNGGLKATCGWEYAEADSTELPPSSITQDNRITRATVDKVNNRIELVTGEENNQAYIKLEAINNAPVGVDPDTGSYIGISADHISINGTVVLSDWRDNSPVAEGGDITKISGSVIHSGKIQSTGYTPPGQDEHYSNTGSEIDLTNSKITTKYFYSDETGAGFKGHLEAASGTFSGNLSASTTDFQKLRVSMGSYDGHTYYGTLGSDTNNGVLKLTEDSGISNPAYLELDRGSNISIYAGEGVAEVSGNIETDITARNGQVIITGNGTNVDDIILNGDVNINGNIIANNIPAKPTTGGDGLYALCFRRDMGTNGPVQWVCIQ